MMNNNSIPNAEDKLDQALMLLATGVPLAEVLAAAGADAQWLRPLLETSVAVTNLGTAIPLPPPQASLERMLGYGQKLAAASAPVQPARPHGVARFLGNVWVPRLFAGFTAVLFVFVLFGSTMTLLAQRSLPGDSLYGLKRMGETLRLGLTPTQEQRQQILENYNLRRQVEAELLLQQGKSAQVEFSGRIESLTATSLAVDGRTIQLTPHTVINGSLAVGARINLQLLTEPPAHLTALTITITEPPSATITPTASPTATPSPTSTATPLPTATPPVSQTGDTLALPTITPTALPTVTSTPLPPAPTVISRPSPEADNDNANTNENENLNDNPDNTNQNGNGNESDNDNSGRDDDSGNNNDDSGSNDNSGGDDSSNGDDDSGGGDNSGSNDHSGKDDNSGGGDNSGSNDKSGGDSDKNDHGGDD